MWVCVTHSDIHRVHTHTYTNISTHIHTYTHIYINKYKRTYFDFIEQLSVPFKQRHSLMSGHILALEALRDGLMAQRNAVSHVV
jgi:hypothetical protein